MWLQSICISIFPTFTFCKCMPTVFVLVCFTVNHILLPQIPANAFSDFSLPQHNITFSMSYNSVQEFAMSGFLPFAVVIE